MEYPRLLLGITMRQKEFVVHPHSLQMLETSWSYGNCRRWSSERTRTLRIIFMFCVHTILLPFTGLMQLVKAQPRNFRKRQTQRRQRRDQVKELDLQKRSMSTVEMPYIQEQLELSELANSTTTLPTSPPSVSTSPTNQPSWFQEFFKTAFWEFDKPQTRCIRDCAAYLWFLIFLSVEIGKSRRNLARYGHMPDVVECLIIVYWLGSTLQLYREHSLQVTYFYGEKSY